MPVYFCIVNFKSGKIEDFIFHLGEDKIIRDSFTLSECLGPGYYALLSFKHDEPELHYEQFWILDKNWSDVVNRMDLKSNPKSPGMVSAVLNLSQQIGGAKLNLWQGDVKLSSTVMNQMSADLLENEIELPNHGSERNAFCFEIVLNDHHGGHFASEWRIFYEGFESHDYSSSVKSRENHSQFVLPSANKDFAEIWLGKLYFNQFITSANTIRLLKSELPIGNLKISLWTDDDEEEVSELLNPPFIPITSQSKSFRSGEMMQFDVPIIDHPWQRTEGLFVTTLLENRSRLTNRTNASGTLLLPDVLPLDDRALVIGTWGFNKNYKNLDIIFTNGEYYAELVTDQDGEVKLTYEMLRALGNREGWMRFRFQERKGKLTSNDIAVAWLESQLPQILARIKWFDPFTIPESVIPKTDSSFDIWMIDLEEITIQSSKGKDLVDEVLDDPFSIHWLNTDWLSVCGVLNCGEHTALIGNGPSISGYKIPLHLYFEMAKDRFIISSMIGAGKGGIPKVSHMMRASFKYSWNPTEWLDQIQQVKLPRTNDLKDQLELKELVEMDNLTWSRYTSGLQITRRAPLIPGEYRLQMVIWDLFSNLPAVIHYDLEIR